jgi:mitotic spindle assembly checkpoint protein MAD1
MEKASLAEQLGAVQPEVSEKEGIIRILERERNKLQTEVEKLKSGVGISDSRAKGRLERQKALAFKEVEYLREQLKTFESEDLTDQIQSHRQEQTHKRIQELESLVNQYRKEIQAANDELSKPKSDTLPGAVPLLKRPHQDERDEHLGQLSRKNRKLQSELSSAQQSVAVIQSELNATKAQLASLQATSRTRVLTLRSNPTDDFQTLKYSIIATLRTENKALLAQLEGVPHNAKVVPIDSLDAARVEIAALQKEVAEKEKMTLRLKQIWTLKSLEFREAVASLLGWKMDFMPNGRFRMTSLFHPGNKDGDGGAGVGNSLIFDGDTGTMKIAGGAESDFAMEIKGLIRFWVQERKEIPGFLAACTLEFYEKTTRALRM